MHPRIKHRIICARRAEERQFAEKAKGEAQHKAESDHIELHHVGQKRYNKDLIIRVYFPQHQELSDMQRHHPAPIGAIPSLNECDAHTILGIVNCYDQFSDALYDIAMRMLEKETQQIAEKDRYQPEKRTNKNHRRGGKSKATTANIHSRKIK